MEKGIDNQLELRLLTPAGIWNPIINQLLFCIIRNFQVKH